MPYFKSVMLTICLVCLAATPALAAPALAAPRIEIDGAPLTTDVPPWIDRGRTMVPLRAIFEALGASVDWDAATATVTARRGNRSVRLAIGSATAYLDGTPVALDVPAQLVASRTFVPLRFVAEAFGARVNWDGATQTVTIQSPAGMTDGSAGASDGVASLPGITTSSIVVEDEGAEVRLQVVRLAPDAPLRPQVALGSGRVGGLESLAGMAERHGAILAVNGTYFNPADYAAKNDLATDPWGILIRAGRVIHASDFGAAIGFDGLGSAGVEELRIQVEGSTGGSYRWPDNWYAYGLNHTVGPGDSAIYIYTPERGDWVGFAHGLKVVVSGGVVTAIQADVDVRIPRNGFVVALTGSERASLAGRFAIGKSADYRVRFQRADGSPVTWPYPETVGAGPLLVRAGRIVTDYRAQGFFEDKVLSLPSARTAIGRTADGSTVIVAGGPIRTAGLARVMQQLGCVDAISLDGGASSGIWLNGGYLVEPGRELSNALLFVP